MRHRSFDEVERAGRAAAGTGQRGADATPTLGHPAARSLSTLDLVRGVAWLLAACLAGATLWALAILALIGVFL